MSDPDNEAEPAEGDAFAVHPVSFGELARWRDRALAAEAQAEVFGCALHIVNVRLERVEGEPASENLAALRMAELAETNAIAARAASRAEKAEAEVERLRTLLYSYAEHAHDSGWTNLASEIRRVAEAD